MYTGRRRDAHARTISSKSQDTLYALAADTGGKAMLDFNDLSVGHRATRRRRSPATTSSAITRPIRHLDGKFRKIKISLKELSAGKLDYRQGYYAGKSSPSSPPPTRSASWKTR